MIKSLAETIHNVIKDNGILSIKLYNSPSNNKEIRHNEGMMEIIQLLGDLTENKDESINFCECTDKTDTMITFSFESELLSIAYSKIKELQKEVE